MFAAGPAWAALTTDQQQALNPLKDRWPQLSDLQRESLARAANHYGAMSPAQRMRFQERLIPWSRLTREQQDQARASFAQFSRLPSNEKTRIRQRWLEANQTQ